MIRTAGYGVASTALTLAGVAALWPLLDGAGREGVAVAAAVALPVQVGAFAALEWGWRQRRRFLVMWMAGIGARLVAVAGVALWVMRSDLPPAETLLPLAGFLFALLLLEPAFLREARSTALGRS